MNDLDPWCYQPGSLKLPLKNLLSQWDCTIRYCWTLLMVTLSYNATHCLQCAFSSFCGYSGALLLILNAIL